ncbi:hypothetical protein [Paracoccus sp. DMF]|uniref:hypothetical protein n=1 Tax=Paracoccus sp. DMF TaxID=400837 RepID=UPI0010FFF6E2|nr:hypothetical protein [Paracoccus sp. DMF]MCV2446670.1 hypothetical protein [Paracoccus sp. DMF]
MELQERLGANETGLPDGVQERLATFAEWTGTTAFPADKVLEKCEGEDTFSDEFLAYVQRVGMSLDWVYLGDAMPLVMRAYNAAQESRA